MFTDLKPYPEYRATPEASSSTPPSWTVRAMRSLIRTRSERGRAELPLLSVARERGVFIRTDADANHNAIPEDLSHYKVARAGDLVINKMKAWQGSLGLAPVDGIVSPAYFVYQFGIADLNYGQALLRSAPYIAYFAAASDGVRVGQWDLSVARLRQIPVLLPPVAEQAAIVRYLAHANARIDRAIAGKRRLIALLEEQKRVVINQAVTRGLDPTAPMKDSGISWLGAIPVHWEVASLRRFWSVTDCKHLTVPFTDEGYALASVTQAQRFFLDLSDGRRTTEEHYRSLIAGGRKPRRGDVIFCRNVGVGSAAVVATDDLFAMGQDVCLLRSASQDPVFLNHFLRSRPMEIQLDRLLVGSTFRRLNVSQIRALQILVPPPGEQQQIVEHLATESSRADAAIARSRREIELLREFRTRLTADVVTGQVDIREIAARLPDVNPAQAAGAVLDLEDDGDLDAEAQEYVEEAFA